MQPSSLEYTFGTDWRTGIYMPRSKYKRQVIATVDVFCNQREILMHNELDNAPFVLSPQKLRKEWKRL